MPYDQPSSDDPLDAESKRMLMEMAGVRFTTRAPGDMRVMFLPGQPNEALALVGATPEEKIDTAFNIYIYFSNRKPPK